MKLTAYRPILMALLLPFAACEPGHPVSSDQAPIRAERPTVSLDLDMAGFRGNSMTAYDGHATDTTVVDYSARTSFTAYAGSDTIETKGGTTNNGDSYLAATIDRNRKVFSLIRFLVQGSWSSQPTNGGQSDFASSYYTLIIEVRDVPYTTATDGSIEAYLPGNQIESHLVTFTQISDESNYHPNVSHTLLSYPPFDDNAHVRLVMR